MTVKQRLLTFITHTGQNVAEFERSCGLSNAYVQNIKQTIMPNKLAQILAVYPSLNCDWLITGRGDMEYSVVPSMHFDTTIFFDEYARLLECCLFNAKPNRNEIIALQTAIVDTIAELKSRGLAHGSLNLLFRRVLRLQNWCEK